MRPAPAERQQLQDAVRPLDSLAQQTAVQQTAVQQQSLAAWQQQGLKAAWLRLRVLHEQYSAPGVARERFGAVPARTIQPGHRARIQEDAIPAGKQLALRPRLVQE